MERRRVEGASGGTRASRGPRWVEVVDRLPRVAVLGLAAALVVLIGLGDWVTGDQISFSVFFLLPVLLVGWRVGRGAALALALASTVAWFLADRATHPPYSHPLIPYWNAGVRLVFLATIGVQLAVLRRVLQREQELATTDHLTGVANSRSFHERARAALASLGEGAQPVAIACLDLDDFKRVNDTLGHEAGDDLLREVARTIRSALRSTDLVARVGGDEFAILLEGTSAADAERVLERVRGDLARASASKGWPVGFSMGAVVCSAPPASLDALVREADELMYAVKREGKGRLAVARSPVEREPVA